MIDKTKKYHVGEKEKKKIIQVLSVFESWVKKKNFFFHRRTGEGGEGGGKNKYTILKDDS